MDTVNLPDYLAALKQQLDSQEASLPEKPFSGKFRVIFSNDIGIEQYK